CLIPALAVPVWSRSCCCESELRQWFIESIGRHRGQCNGGRMQKKASRSERSVNTPENTTQIFQQYRVLLFSIAYRMLSSATDAEDIVQEAFLRWMQEDSREVQ